MSDLRYYKEITIGVSAESLYRALTCPKHLRAWREVVAQYALRPQGHFTIASLDGDVFESGEFLEVKENKYLRYRMEHHGFYIGSEVAVSLSEKESNRTELSFEHVNLSKSDLPHASVSWDWALENLKSYLESGKTQTFDFWFKERKQNYNL